MSTIKEHAKVIIEHADRLIKERNENDLKVVTLLAEAALYFDHSMDIGDTDFKEGRRRITEAIDCLALGQKE
jgi:hypothetical protein